jgi:hypothetical protein
MRERITYVQRAFPGAKVALRVTSASEQGVLKSLKLGDVHPKVFRDFKNPEVVKIPPLTTDQLSGLEYGKRV